MLYQEDFAFGVFFLAFPHFISSACFETSETYLFFNPSSSRVAILQFQTPKTSNSHLLPTSQEMIQPKLHSALSMVAPVDINPCLLGDRAPQMDEARGKGCSYDTIRAYEGLDNELPFNSGGSAVLVFGRWVCFPH